MSKSNSAKSIVVFSFAFVVSIALITADIVVQGQDNQNTENTMGAQNENTGMHHRRGRRRSGRRSRPRSEANANVSGEAQDDTSMDASMSTSGGEQTDLSGTYTGQINYPEGGLTGDSTLTINGNQFTLTSGSTTQTGRVTSVTTRGYTAVTMQFGDATPPAPGQAGTTPTIISLRARRVGDNLVLTPVPGERREFAFSTGSAGVGRRHRGRRGRGHSTNTNTSGETNENGNMNSNTSTP